MTKQRKLKKQIRARKAAKQETYTEARRKTLKPLEARACSVCGSRLGEEDGPNRCDSCDLEAMRESERKAADDTLRTNTKATLLRSLVETGRLLPACDTKHGECVLAKGHRSDEHGDDHLSPDGTWWNVGWVRETAERIDRMAVDALLSAGSEGPTTPITGAQPLTREGLEKTVADYKVRHRYESADPADVGALWDRPDVPVRGFAEPVPKAAAVTIGDLRKAASAMQAAEGEQVLKDVAKREGPFPCPRCGTDMVDGGIDFFCPKKDCLPELPKAGHSLTVDVGDMPPEVAATFIERLKVQWKRMALDTKVVAPENREEFERQAEKMALGAADVAMGVYAKQLDEAAFIAELRTLAKKFPPPPRVEAPSPSELPRKFVKMTDEEQRAFDEAMKNQPPCTCEADSATCRFHRAPIVNPSEVPMTQWKPDSESSIQSRPGTLGEEFWLVRGGKDVYRLGYKDRSGRTILGDEGNCTCPKRDGASSDCEFHHPKQTVDVAQRLVDRAVAARGRPVRVTVNGKLVEVDGPTMDYRAVVSAAGYNPERVLSVTWRSPSHREGGTLWPGKAPVPVETGAVFNVADTSNA